MNLAVGIAMLWLGAALAWVAWHGTEAKTPWEVWQQITGKLAAADA